jgi:hypothetical protein
MWPVPGIPAPSQWLDFEPVEILYEFDYPLLYTCKDAAGELFMVYMCGEDKNGVRYLVVPCRDELDKKLVAGQVDVREALYQSPAWIFDLDNNWEPLRAWSVAIDDLPPNAIPRPGLMLYAHLPPKAAAPHDPAA